MVRSRLLVGPTLCFTLHSPEGHGRVVGGKRGSNGSCDEIVARADEERDCRIGDLSRLNIITARETSVLSSPIQSPRASLCGRLDS